MTQKSYCASFKKYEKIKNNKEFEEIFKRGNKIKGEKIIIFTKTNNFQSSRLGIALSKEFKKVSIRNYFKRIAREVFRRNKHMIPAPADVIILIRKTVSFKELENFFIRVFTDGE
ncbi:MAG: ribonuclease P protein component [Planctomycetota bacterium]